MGACTKAAFSAKLKCSLACTVQVQKSYCAMGQRLLQRPSYGCLYNSCFLTRVKQQCGVSSSAAGVALGQSWDSTYGILWHSRRYSLLFR